MDRNRIFNITAILFALAAIIAVCIPILTQSKEESPGFNRSRNSK